MGRLILHWAVTAAAVAVAGAIVPGVHVASWGMLLVVALVLGLVNAIIRPILVILTLPITILTLGLFYLVVNGFAFGLAFWLVPGASLDGWLSAILGALLVGLVSWILGAIVGGRR